MRVCLSALGLLSLYSTAQAAAVSHLSPRDACGADMKCNAEGCAGTNDFNTPDLSYCTSGDCAGQPCTSVCTDTPGPCGDQGCNGFLDGENWWCSAGDFKGCSCTSICPAADKIPECSDPDCGGSSNTNQKFGICGAGKFPSCTCKNSCPSDVPKCSDDGCKGINDPDGDKSVCTAGPSMGCPCNSECPTGKCNEIDGCEGYNNVDGKGLCSAGASIGCYCDAVCPTDKVTCSDDKCSGVQPKSGDGDGFCIAGDFKGCPCATKCPDSKPACSDENCDGVGGRCNIGESKGCECTGDDASLKKRSLSSFSLFKRVEPNGYSNIPSASYTCRSLLHQDDGGEETYSSVEIEDTMRQGWQLYLRHDGVRAQNGRYYPNRFVNDGTFIIPTYINQNDLREFPLTHDTNGGAGFREGDDAGPDRVIYEGATGRFAGVVTHRGEPGNEFHQTYGHGDNPNFRTPNGAGFEPAPIRGPTNIDVDPLAYVWGTHMDGSNGLWAKRDTADTPGGTKDGGDDGNGDNPDVGKAVCGAGQGNPAKTFDLAYGEAAINYFCSQGGTRQIASSSTYNKETIYGQQDLPDDKQTTDVAVITRMYYVNVPGCSTKAGAIYEPSIDDCKKGFEMAMNECQTDTTTAKAASYKVQDLGDKGCVAFDLMPCPEVDKKASNDCDPFYGDYAKFKLG